MVSTRSQGQNDDNVDVDVANSNELDALNLAHGQTSNDSIANMQVAQNDNEISRLLSLQQLSLDDIHCSLDFVNNFFDANESTDMCREFFVETEQKVYSRLYLIVLNSVGWEVCLQLEATISKEIYRTGFDPMIEIFRPILTLAKKVAIF